MNPDPYVTPVAACRGRPKPAIRLCLTVWLALWLAVPAPAAEPAGLLEGFGRGQLLISTAAKGCTLIDIYIAETPQQRSQGLMHVRAMGAHEGMLFVYPQVSLIRMWMKNTWLPLDMLFADASGRILHVHRDARPHDESIISSQLPVSYVLELNAGSVARFGIEVGDQLATSAGISTMQRTL